MVYVALRKESVDRNLYYGDDLTFADVALRKESVDRNTSFLPASLLDLPSLSARRAWIEMVYLALIRYLINTSLSARRAWIEIFRPPPQVKPVRSLSARRAWIEIQ